MEKSERVQRPGFVCCETQYNSIEAQWESRVSSAERGRILRRRKVLFLAVLLILTIGIQPLSVWASEVSAPAIPAGVELLTDGSSNSGISSDSASSGAVQLPSALLTEAAASGLYRTALDYDYFQGGLPSYYSVTDLGKKPTVKSQGSLGTCWAITATSAIESALLPEKQVVLSADHLSLNNGFDITQEEGGDYYMIMSYMADWKGPVPEEDDPYGDGVSPDGLQSVLHVQQMRLLKGMNRMQIQQMIYTCGAVQSSLCMDRTRTDSADYEYYDAQTYAYRDPNEEKLNHDILILGWDDDYPKENFRLQPEEDGAWICLNTWGEDFGDDGLFCVSYEDANLFRKGGIAYTQIDSPDDYARVYENDSLGWQARQGYGSDECYFAGVFTAEADETLSAVGLYATGAYTAFNVYIIPEFESAADLQDRTQGIAWGWAVNPGYYTVQTDEQVQLTKGQRFAVCVWIQTQDAERPVAVETAKDKYTQSVTLEGRETYTSADGDVWERTQEIYGTNVCLKVYTS